MEKEHVIEIRDEAKKNNNMLMIITDNEHVFYDNVKDSIPIVWDDEGATFTTIMTNFSQVTPRYSPFMKTTVQYEQIQFMNIFLSEEEATEFVKKNITDQDQLKKSLGVISRVRSDKFSVKNTK